LGISGSLRKGSFNTGYYMLLKNWLLLAWR
jgi:hypothetical protein